jgi:hypothetical protein
MKDLLLNGSSIEFVIIIIIIIIIIILTANGFVPVAVVLQ